MTFPDDEPELAPPLAARQASRLVPILLLLGIIGGGVYASTGIDQPEAGKAPSRPEDLSANIVTFVAPDDRAGVAAAVAALKVTTAQRAEIAQTVIEGKRRIGWIVFTDSIDPDGDTIAVESSGLTQQVVLTKSWTPVAVLLEGAPIHVTALRDGVAGGVTIAFATGAGVMPMRIMRPGERIEVMP
ncbi:MAG: hypothetical protein H0V72_29220 [Bradyrhizobium sp.]|nr:hypothetical protein [Bradyrhizobium sp.]